MPLGRMYTDEENVFLMIMREGTTLSWQEIADIFNETFETSVTARDLGDKYSARLRGSPRAWALDQLLKSALDWAYDPDHVHFLTLAMVVLRNAPENIRYRLPGESDGIAAKTATRRRSPPAGGAPQN